MKKRSDREEFRLNLLIFFGVIVFAFFVINFLSENYIAPLTGNVIDPKAGINPVTGPVVKVCPTMVCPTGYTRSDTDGDGCPDTCSGGIVSPVTCPYHEACLVGYTLTDTNGDGCLDSCVSSVSLPSGAICGNGICDAEESSSYDIPCPTGRICSALYVPRGYTTCSQDCPGQPTQSATSLCGNGICDREEFINCPVGVPFQTINLSCLTCQEDCIDEAAAVLCTENWNCSNWNICISGTQSRSCADLNGCGTISKRPSESKTCGCVEDWQCSKFTACVNGEQHRSCTDNNNCGTISDKPDETQNCIEGAQKIAMPDKTVTTSESTAIAETVGSAETVVPITQAQQPASQNNSASILVILTLLAGAIGGVIYLFLRTMKRKKLVGQLDEVLKRASSALSTGDLKGANNNYSVLREYYSTYQNKLPKKDAVRFSIEALKVYNELAAKQKAMTSQIA